MMTPTPTPTRSLAALAVLLLLLTASLFISTSRLPPGLFSSFSSSSSPAAPSPTPLRVFMYDLPRRFNLDMLGGAGSAGFPPWPRTSGLKKQHSVEYWMMASLVAGGGGDGAEAVRVVNAAAAEVFFVPFFSSLSFNTHGHNMTDPDTEFDRLLQDQLAQGVSHNNLLLKYPLQFNGRNIVLRRVQTEGLSGPVVDLLDFLRNSKYWQLSAGRDHVVPMHHPNAFRFLRDQVNASILVVADFGRYPKTLSSLSKDIVAPYVHVVDSFVDDNSSDPFESRPTLLFFRGRTIRKDEGIVRKKLKRILKGYNDVRFEDGVASGDGVKASTQGMRSSKFCLHPAGDTPSSCRLFDAIVNHCVPVIVSDRIELPFEDEIDYSEFSIFFSVQEALVPDFMVNHLRQITRERWVEMWKKLKDISHHYEFQSPTKKDDAVNMVWREVRHKLPAVNLAVHRSRRLKIPDWWNRR